jgi:hypothetical protein
MPTLKQIATARDLLENPSKSVSQAMRDNGYSPETAKVPSDLTKSKGWAELMKDALPDETLLAVHRAGLVAEKPIGALVLIKNGKDGKPETILKSDEGQIMVEDHPTRHKFLETAYKLKKYIGVEGTGNPQFNAEEMNIVFTK